MDEQVKSPDRNMKIRLMGLGYQLLEPPAEVNRLLVLLNRIQRCLSNVNQVPSASMKNALEPIKRALILEGLLKHTNVDIKVAVAHCLVELCKITAPDPPYDDNTMKEIFRAIVTALEGLFDMSSPSYSKRLDILESFAEIHLCTVMLDLECVDLLLEMFHHSVKAIRVEGHSGILLSSIVQIMALAVGESNDPLGLLRRILRSLDRNMIIAFIIGQELGLLTKSGNERPGSFGSC